MNAIMADSKHYLIIDDDQNEYKYTKVYFKYFIYSMVSVYLYFMVIYQGFLNVQLKLCHMNRTISIFLNTNIMKNCITFFSNYCAIKLVIFYFVDI